MIRFIDRSFDRSLRDLTEPLISILSSTHMHIKFEGFAVATPLRFANLLMLVTNLLLTILEFWPGLHSNHCFPFVALRSGSPVLRDDLASLA